MSWYHIFLRRGWICHGGVCLCQFQAKSQNYMTFQRHDDVTNNEKLNFACYFCYKVDIYCKLKTKIS
jgi:hypothetical protein